MSMFKDYVTEITSTGMISSEVKASFQRSHQTQNQSSKKRCLLHISAPRKIDWKIKP